MSSTGPYGFATNTYNGLGARAAKYDGTGNYAFKRNGASPTSPVLSDGMAAYTPGFAEMRGGVSRLAASDYLGTHSRMLDPAGATQSTRRYDAFGLQLSATGTNPSPFGFAGSWGYQEDNNGLKLLGHRHYDPSTGRFLTRDPIKDGRNWYAYAGNRPTVAVDPTGLGAIGVGAIVGALFFAWKIYDFATTAEAIVREPTDWTNYVGFAPVPGGAVTGKLFKKASKLRAVGPDVAGSVSTVAPRLSKAEQLAKNREAGLAAEERVWAQIESLGHKVSREKRVVNTPFGRRIHDGALLNDDGSIRAYLEIKSGGAKFKKSQHEKDGWISEVLRMPTIDIRDPWSGRIH